MTWWGWLISIAGAGFVLHIALCALENRGLIYYRRSRGRGSVGGGVMGELLNAFQPTRQVIIAEREWQRVRVDAAESGEGSGHNPEVVAKD